MGRYAGKPPRGWCRGWSVRVFFRKSAAVADIFVGWGGRSFAAASDAHLRRGVWEKGGRAGGREGSGRNERNVEGDGLASLDVLSCGEAVHQRGIRI